MRNCLAIVKQRFVPLVSRSGAAFAVSVPGAALTAILGVAYILTAALVEHRAGLLRLAAKL